MLEARDLFAESLWPNALVIVAPLVACFVLATWIVRRRLGPVAAAGIVLGIGLGGFVDGILFHQILQWHSMLSSVVPPTELVAMKLNMIWDGTFHLLTWTACGVGIVMLFRAGRDAAAQWSSRVLGGSALAGWGVFNLVEGTLDHFILGIHHVRPGAHQLAWDVGFVTLGGVGFLLVGILLALGRSGPRIAPR